MGKSERHATRYKETYFTARLILFLPAIPVLFKASTAAISKSVASNDVLKLTETSPKYASLEGDVNAHTA